MTNMTVDKRQLRMVALQLLTQSESDAVDWSEVEQAAVELRLFAQVHQIVPLIVRARELSPCR